MSTSPTGTRRALVTGASGALGQAIAERLGRDGVHVIAHASAKLDAANAVVVDDSESATRWAAEARLRGVVVRREAGERFEDSVLRAFDEVSALL